MIRLGLCSVTFRKKSPEEVIEIARSNGLDGIEWGGDIHVPPKTAPSRVREIVDRCRAAGITIPSYGSYFNVLDHNPEDFTPIVETASLLGAGVIRIWAGWVKAGEMTPAQFEKIVSTSRQAAQMASGKKIKVAYEFHDNTPTEGGDNAIRLLQGVNHPNLYTYFQAVRPNDYQETLRNLEKVYPKLLYIHVQNNDGENSLPLVDFSDMWQEIVRRLIGRKYDGYLFFEFNVDNSPEQLAKDVDLIRGFMARQS